MLRTGAAWRDLPLNYGNWKSVYNRYNNWSKKGYITTILAELKKDGDHEWHILDGSIIKVHQDAMRSSYDKSLEAIGRSVGGLSTKIHANVKVDEPGLFSVSVFRMTSITDAVCCNTSLFQKRNTLKPCAFNQSLRFLSSI